MYSDSYDYDQYVLAVANIGFLGLTWTPELRKADSASEFARRSQLVLFSGLANLNDWAGGSKPYPPDVSASSAAIFKFYLNARLELVPALYAASRTAGTSGLPAVRHPLLDFPEVSLENNALSLSFSLSLFFFCLLILFFFSSFSSSSSSFFLKDHVALRDVQNEFMFTSLLVAPAAIAATSRQVYFPANAHGWVDYFDNSSSAAPHPGGSTANVSCDDTCLPVFQQVGSVVPLASLGRPEVLRLRAVAPPAGAEPLPPTLVYDDDGRTLNYQRRLEFHEAWAQVARNPTNGSIVVTLGITHTAWTPAWTRLQFELALHGYQATSVSCAHNDTALDTETSRPARGLLTATVHIPASARVGSLLACHFF
mgnify:CR=1 FL=1